MSIINKIKARWPLIAMLERLGIDYKEKGAFKSPFREDKKPSCDIYKEVIMDRATGERFDSIACFAKVNGLSNEDAIKALAKELPDAKRSEPDTSQSRLIIPQGEYSQTKAEAVAELRGLPVSCIESAASLGMITFAKVCGLDSWILFDGNEKIAEARRVDGELYPAFGGLDARKSHTLKGSKKSWPIGLKPRKGNQEVSDLRVIIVEGGADFLALYAIKEYAKTDFLPVAMLGASNRINKGALPFFAGREVIILADDDDAGVKAAQVWRDQLEEILVTVRAERLKTGVEKGDLNDLVKRLGAKAVAEGLGL